MMLTQGYTPAGELARDEPMRRRTSWRVGGPADWFYRPASVDDLAATLAAIPPDMPVMFVGLGSNLLVRDGGVRGLVVTTAGLLDDLRRVDGNVVEAGAGVACAVLARQCVRWQLGPAEFFAGIPGTLGGALAMNAGAWGGETWRFVVSVTTVDRRGGRHERSADEYTVGYRSVEGPAGEWFLGVRLQFEYQPDASRERINALLAERKARQPLGVPSCGSVFRNPPGDHAARLIEACGLKGARRGGAEVSPKHANFIVNRGDATAADIEALIEHVAATVEREHGVTLVREVRIVGEPA